jgi:hypothetical protein
MTGWLAYAGLAYADLLNDGHDVQLVQQRRDLRFTDREGHDPRPLDAVPPWFTAAITIPYDTGSVDVDGVTIAYRAWGAWRG